MTGLRALEAKLKRSAKALGLTFDRVIFKRASPDEINEIAAFGIPNRYMHWVFGAAYKERMLEERNKQSHILEIVINSTPVIARLSTENSEVEDMLSLIHI